MRLKPLSLSLSPLALLSVSCAPSPEVQARIAAEADADLGKQLAGLREAGVDKCIPGEVRSTIIDNRRIVWREGARGKAWVSNFEVACSGMREGDTLIIERIGSQLCRMDTVQPLTPGSSIPGAKCALRDFTRFEPAP